MLKNWFESVTGFLLGHHFLKLSVTVEDIQWK